MSITRQPGWLPGVELLRGLAAAAVVVYHTWVLSTHSQFVGSSIVAGLGAWGVNLFFMLSGYLLCSYFWEIPRRSSMRVYAIRRFFRIAPAYYVNISILFLFFAQTSLLFSPTGLKQLLANFTFTQYLFPSTASSLNVNGSLWTLTIEACLYALLPLIALAFARRPGVTFLAMFAVGICWRLVIALNGDAIRELYFGNSGAVPISVQNYFLSHQFLGLLPIFALGIGLKWLSQSALPSWLSSAEGWLPGGLVPVVISLVPSLLWLTRVADGSSVENLFMFTSFDYVMGVLFCLPLVMAAQSTRTPRTFVGLTGTWLGDRSYSLYLWHFPIILVVFERGSQMLPPQTTHLWLRVTLICALCLGFAHVSYTLVERPGLLWGRRVVSRVREERLAPEVP